MIKALGGIVLIFAIVQFASANIYDGLVNKRIDRTIDLTSQIARHTLEIEVTNSGSKAANEYFLTIQAPLARHLALIQASSDGAALKVSKDKDESSYSVYRIALSKPVAPQGTVNIIVEASFTHTMTPYPAAIAQDERQLVRYADNHFVYSPYTTTSQTTIVKMATSNIEGRSEQAPSSLKGDMITYGPYEDIAAFSSSDMHVHFENGRPFITVNSLVKEIEISHWGNIAVEESYDLQHDGAKLKGTFSRFDYQRTPAGKGSVVAAFKQVLPIGAADVYYRDEIGNISTSHLFETENGPVMDVIPRFPLFGGWKIGFYFGYNLPTSQYLFTDAADSSRYLLNVTFASALQDFVIDHLTVRIVLPEGAKNFEKFIPFEVDGESTATHFTYLDTSGRPVIIIYKKNVVPEHNQFFQFSYHFSQLSLLQEPILLIGAYFFFFLAFLAYNRLPSSIGSEVKTRNTPAEKAEGFLLQLRDIFDQRAEQHANLADALSKYLKTKNSAAYLAEKKAAETALTNIASQVQSLAAHLDDVAVDFARKVRELEKKELKKAGLEQQIQENETSYKVKRSIQKDAYEATKESLEKQFTAVDDEIEGLVADLTEHL